MAQGTPEQVAGKAGSHTGRFLARLVKPAANKAQGRQRPKVAAAA